MKKKNGRGERGNKHPHVQGVAMKSVSSVGPMLVPEYQNHIGVGFPPPSINPSALVMKKRERCLPLPGLFRHQDSHHSLPPPLPMIQFCVE